jgi:hypothetical protein
VKLGVMTVASQDINGITRQASERSYGELAAGSGCVPIGSHRRIRVHQAPTAARDNPLARLEARKDLLWRTGRSTCGPWPCRTDSDRHCPLDGHSLECDAAAAPPSSVERTDPAVMLTITRGQGPTRTARSWSTWPILANCVTIHSALEYPAGLGRRRAPTGPGAFGLHALGD